MKLIQLYANKENFRRVTFKDGINIVVGQIKDQRNYKKDSHNLGKTTLIHLIDFMLLKEINKDHFLKKQQFKGYVFYLEIMSNSGQYITIRRSTDKNTKISFKYHSKPMQNYINESMWDDENIPLKGKDDENPKLKLNALLGFDVLQNYSYRNTINYFLRTQNDYQDVFKLSKNVGKHINWKPILYQMLGFSSEFFYEKLKKDDEVESLKKNIENIEKEFKIDETLRDKLMGLIDIKEDELYKKSKEIEKFDFYMNERGLNKQIIDEIETKISELNSLEYNITFEINKINESFEETDNIDLQEVFQIYEEASIFFDGQLKKSYKDLLEFNNKLTSERTKHLVNVLKKKKEKLSEIREELARLNEKRQVVLGSLQEKDVFKKFKKYQDEVSDLQVEIAKIQNDIDNVDVVSNIRKKLTIAKNDQDDLKEKISQEIKKSNNLYKGIKRDYYHLMNDVLSKDGVLSIYQNQNGNVEFKAEIENMDHEATAEDQGHSYKKLLCMIFDITLLKNYYDKSFFKFVYHDGPLEVLDPRKQVKYLDMIVKLCNQKPELQYIFTMIESDLPMIEGNKKYPLSDFHIAVELNDDEDGKGTLFGFEF